MAKIMGIIPARYASTRFPGKPLVDIKGKSMIRRVYERALKAKMLDGLCVATDDERIFSHVEDFGGHVVMTAEHHQSGTERIAEVARQVKGYTYFVNIQGDEPFLNPEQIDFLCNCLEEQQEAEIATLVRLIDSTEELFDPNVVKMVRDEKGFALYFSRSPIPFARNTSEKDLWLSGHPYYKHLGIYGFTREILLKIPDMPASSLEKTESLEQLRWLSQGVRIYTAITEGQAVAIDTPEDLEKL